MSTTTSSSDQVAALKLAHRATRTAGDYVAVAATRIRARAAVPCRASRNVGRMNTRPPRRHLPNARGVRRDLNPPLNRLTSPPKRDGAPRAQAGTAARAQYRPLRPVAGGGLDGSAAAQ
jgi:hypothetical protein